MSTQPQTHAEMATARLETARYRDEIGEPDVAAAVRAEAQVHATLAVAEHLATIAGFVKANGIGGGL